MLFAVLAFNVRTADASIGLSVGLGIYGQYDTGYGSGYDSSYGGYPSYGYDNYSYDDSYGSYGNSYGNNYGYNDYSYNSYDCGCDSYGGSYGGSYNAPYRAISYQPAVPYVRDYVAYARPAQQLCFIGSRCY